MGSRTPGLSWLRRPELRPQFVGRHTETVRRRVGLWALITWLVVAVSMSLMALPGAAGIKALTYNQTVLADQPVGFWTSNVDLTSHGRNGTFSGGPTVAVMPNYRGPCSEI